MQCMGIQWLDYYEAVCNWMKRRHQLDINADNIVTTTGVVTALKIAVNAFTAPGDAIIINKPVYYPFDFSIDENQRKKIECPMMFTGQTYELDFDLFEQLIIDNDVKMFILCNPYNPIGKVWNKEELFKLGNICKKHNGLVVRDEIHQDFIYKGGISTFLLLMLMPHLKNLQLFVQHQVRLSIWRVYRRLIYYFLIIN